MLLEAGCNKGHAHPRSTPIQEARVHIPDGYLSPATCGALGAAMVPVWVTAGRRVKAVVKQRYVPYVALGAAFSFLVMMFNVPVPDGTTAHAVGATLVAVLLGPWAAVIAVSTALVIQALFFGDGGVLALGANCFNMAFVMPFVGYGVYRLLARRMVLTSPRRAVAAGVGAYVGINAAALAAAVEFGLQPVLFTSANGTPLYAPFHLSQTIPAMMLAHLTVAGGVELALTVGVITYLQRANVPVLRINHRAVPLEVAVEPPRKLGWKWAFVGLGALALLTPLGLLAPGGAFGEDSPQQLDLGRYGLRAVPTGLARWSSFWDRSVLGGYGFRDGQHATVGYVLSALVGMVAVGVAVVAVYGAVRLVSRVRREPPAEPARPTAGSRPAQPAPVDSVAT
jgi:cobalt/nickel transport system permease protein